MVDDVQLFGVSTKPVKLALQLRCVKYTQRNNLNGRGQPGDEEPIKASSHPTRVAPVLKVLSDGATESLGCMDSKEATKSAKASKPTASLSTLWIFR